MCDANFTSDFYKAIVKNSTELISVLDQAGEYMFVGASVEPVLGYEAHELLGTNAIDYIHKNDAAFALSALEKICTEKEVRMLPLRFKAKNGDWRWIECTITNMLDNESVRGIVANSRDVTQEVENELKKEQSQSFYKSLFHDHPDAVFTLNTDGYFEDANKQFPRLINYSEEEIKGKHFTELVHPSYTKEVTYAFNKALAGQAHTIEALVLTKQGKEIDICVTIVPIFFKGSVEGVHVIARDITQLKRSDRLIREQADQLNSVVESIAEPFFALDKQWCYTYVNKAYAAFLGKYREEMLGNNIWETYPQSVHSLFYYKCHEVASSGLPVSFEEPYSKPREAVIRFSVFPSSNGISVYFRDVIEERGLEAELEKLSLVASQTTNGVIITDGDGKVEWVNNSFERLTGYSFAEVLHKEPGELLQGVETDQETVARIRKKLAEAVPFSEEILNYRKNGEKVWFSMIITPILDTKGHVSKFIAIQSDTTDKKRSELELKQMASDLSIQNKSLQQFTYFISHNLRAPVANASGLAALLPRIDKNSKKFESVLSKLQTSVSHLDSIIKDMNTILSLRDGNQLLPLEDVNLSAVCTEVINSLQESIVELGVTTLVDVDTDCVVQASKAYLHNIFYNLLLNAIKYRATDRKLIIAVKCRQNKDGEVEIIISDNGSGMEMGLVKDQLFKLYKRFHLNTTGRGVGLFLVKTQVEAMKGRIEVDSTPNVGTSFKIYLKYNVEESFYNR
ncbi:PAS domain S-box protein [Pontibacter silvestris]|nr:PAS domain S-box protein [Pontibacter silvestris]